MLKVSFPKLYLHSDVNPVDHLKYFIVDFLHGFVAYDSTYS
jgi:hypothetical protein